MVAVLKVKMNDVYLCELVSQFPCLYDIKDESNKDQIMKDSKWKTISEILGQPVVECKKRWKNIRDTYHRSRKLGRDASKWYLTDAVAFLDKTTVRKRKTNRNFEQNKSQTEDNSEDGFTDSKELVHNSIEESCEEEKQQEIFQPSVEPALKKFRRDSHTEHPIDIFFKSMSEFVKNLSPTNQIKAKLEICRVVGKLELEDLNEKSVCNIVSSLSSARQQNQDDDEDSLINIKEETIDNI